MECSQNSHLGNIKAPYISSRSSTRITFYRLKNVLYPTDALIKFTLSCITNVGKCTGISGYLVNLRKNSSVLYSTVRKRSLLFCYGMNWLTVTKP